jgi:hypothetical protein
VGAVSEGLSGDGLVGSTDLDARIRSSGKRWAARSSRSGSSSAHQVPGSRLRENDHAPATQRARIVYFLVRRVVMPEISRFLGIAIFMYWDDHGPPHFHARYGNDRAKLRISPVSLAAGRLPPRVVALIVEWASLHEAELLANWDRCRRREPPVRIPPLE